MPIESTPVNRQDTIVLEHPYRNLTEATCQERQLQYNKSNESMPQHGNAGGPGYGVNKPEPQPSPEATEADWVFVPPSAPSITNSSTSSGGANDPQPKELTASTLQLHNMLLEKGPVERIWERRESGSVIAQKGANTRASNDSTDPLGSWAPVQNAAESDIFAAGSWADSPRPPVL